MRKDHRTLRRRPLFTPVWLTVIGAVVAALIIFWVWGTTGVSTVLIVRHAEKLATAEADPALSAAGIERARLLAQMLQDVPLTIIYVTELQRTRDTAGPVAEAGGTNIVEVAADDVDELLRRLRGHRRDTVLVVGHSNTIPDIVRGLGGETPPMAEDEYTRLLIVTTGRLVRTRVLSLYYGA